MPEVCLNVQKDMKEKNMNEVSANGMSAPSQTNKFLGIDLNGETFMVRQMITRNEELIDSVKTAQEDFIHEICAKYGELPPFCELLDSEALTLDQFQQEIYRLLKKRYFLDDIYEQFIEHHNPFAK